MAERLGRGRGGPRQRIGGATKCVCSSCGYEIVHERETPCQSKAAQNVDHRWSGASERPSCPPTDTSGGEGFSCI